MLSRALDIVRRHRAGVLAVLWGPGLTMLGMALASRVLTQVTSAATFGEVKLLQGAVGLGLGLVARPFTQFAMREYHEAQTRGRGKAFEQYILKRQLQLGAVLSVVTIGALAITKVTAVQLSWPIVVVAGPTLVAEMLLSAVLALALTRNEQRTVSTAEVVRQWGVSALAAAAMYFIADSAVLFVFAQTLFTFVCGATLYIRARPRVPDPPTPSETVDWNREAWGFVLPMLGAGLFNWFISVGDRYLLAYYCTDSEVGRYAAVYGVVSAPILAGGGSMARFLFPLVFRAAAEKRAASQRAMIRALFLTGLAVGLAATGSVALLGPLIVRLLLAPSFREGAQPLMIWLAAGHACLIVSFSLEMTAFARKRTRVFTISSGLAAATNLGLNLFWIPREHALGAAKATFCGYVVYLLVNVVLLWRPGRQDEVMVKDQPTDDSPQ